jgi:glycosyltransferase involved in cell wall biosynthesis
MPESPLTVSVAIPTMNRPKDLERCVRSIAVQTRLPDEVVVADDGDLDTAPIRAILDGLPTRFVYFKKDKKGLARSRNALLARTSGDIVIFLDDDTELDPGYIQGYLFHFENDPAGRIGGMSGMPTRFLHGVELPPIPPVRFTDRLERFFLLASGRGGRVLLSGSRSPMTSPEDRTPVEFLQGGNMALRRKICDEYQFDELLDRFGGYSLGEDVIFSYPIGKKYELYSTNRARLKHFATPGNRPNKRNMNRMKIVHQYRFIRLTMHGGVVHHLAFAWALTGMVVINSLVFLRRPDVVRWANLEGIFAGIFHILRHGADNPG